MVMDTLNYIHSLLSIFLLNSKQHVFLSNLLFPVVSLLNQAPAWILRYLFMSVNCIYQVKRRL